MTTRVFAITAVDSTAQLNAERKGETSFTISNTTKRALTGRVNIVPLENAQADWFKVEGETERNFSVSETQQFTVKIAIPVGTAAGQYEFRLEVISTENPDEDFAESPTVTFEVKPSEAPKPFPWWIIVAGAIAVLVIGGGITTWLLLKPEKEAEPLIGDSKQPSVPTPEKEPEPTTPEKKPERPILTTKPILTTRPAISILRTMETPPVKFGQPVGGPGGADFADMPAGLSRVAKVKVRSGWWIDAIQVVYELSDGSLKEFPQHGGNGGGASEFVLEKGEYIIGISGKSGQFVGQLIIHTNKKTSPAYGLAKGNGSGPDFKIRAPSGSEVVGFYGRSGTYLDAVGIMTRPLN